MAPVQNNPIFYNNINLKPMNKPGLTIACILMVIILPFRVDAQWYKSYGANHPGELSEADLVQALRKTEKIISTGYTVGAIGVLTAGVGGIIYSTNLIEIENSHYYDLKFHSDRARLGTYLMAGGIGLAGCALPFLITGYSRKIEIQIALSGLPANISFIPDISIDRDFLIAGIRVGITF
jgi:hypothetical protein